MKLIRKLAFNNIFKNKRGSLLTIVSVALSVSLTTMVVSIMFGFYNEMKRETLENSRQSNVSVYGVYDIESFIDGIGRDVVDAYTASDHSLSIKLPEGGRQDYTTVVGLDILEEAKFLPIKASKYDKNEPTSGRHPENESEVVLTSYDREMLGNVEIGDSVELYSMEYIRDGSREPTEVVTFARNATIVGFIEYNSSYYYSSTKELPVLNMNTTDNAYSVDIKFKDGTKNIEDYVEKGLNTDIVKQYEDEKGVKHYSVRYFEEFNTYKGMQRVFTTTQKVMIGATLFLVIILSAATFSLIFNAFNILVEQNIQTYGLLRSVGATKPQIKRIVRIEGYTLSILGTSIGSLIGFGIASALTAYINHQIQVSKEVYEAGLNLYFTAILPWWSLVAVAVLSLLMTTIPMNRTIRRLFSLTSIESLRRTEKKRKRKKKKVQTLNQKMSLPLQIAQINNKNAQTKVRGIQATLVVSLTMFIAISSIIASTLTQISPQNYSFNVRAKIHTRDYSSALEYEKLIQETLSNDVNIKEFHSISSFSASMIDSNLKAIKENPKIPNREGSMVSSDHISYLLISDADYKNLCTLNNLNCDKENGTLVYNYYEGDIDIYQEKEHIIYDYSGTILELEENDTFKVGLRSNEASDDSQSNKLAKHSQDFKIDGFVNEFPDYMGPSRSNYPIVTVYVPQHLSTRLFEGLDLNSTNNRHLGYFNSTGISIESKDPYATEQLLKDLDISTSNVWFSNLAKEQASGRQIADTIHTIVSSILFFIGAVSILNMINITITNFNLRKRTIASYQSVGMTQKQMNQMYLYESMIQFSKPLILGLVLGTIVSYVFYLVLSTQIESSLFRFSFDIKSYLIALIFIAAAVAINLITLRSQSKRLSIIESMREL